MIDIEENNPLHPESSSIILKENFWKKLDAIPQSLSIGRISLTNLYQRWVPLINSKIMKSEDLLNQILVAYTIKRALNGWKEAIQALYSLYENTTAQAIAIKMAKRFNVEIKDIKQDGQILLHFLIAGFRPEYILKKLVTEGGKGLLWPFLNG